MSKGGGGLLVREGEIGGLWIFPHFPSTPSKPGGSGEGEQAEKTHWTSGLGPQPGGASPGPYSALQTQGSFPASLSTRSCGPNPRQRSPSL